MRPEEYRLLQAACQATAKTHPELQQSQRETPNASAQSIETEISGFLGAVRKDRDSVYKSAEETLQPLMLLYDLALLQVCDMSYFGLKNFDHRSKIIWPNLPLPKRPPPNAVFYVLASNLAQSMQAFQLLIPYGFESQARGTFRSVVEIVDLMITVLAREGTYREYTKSYEDPKASYQHWRSHLSPSVIRNFISKLEVDDPITISIDMTPTDIRKDTYSWLSKFVHADFAAHVVSAHPSNSDETFKRLGMLGDVSDMSRATLAHALVYLWISLLRLERLLFEKHSWGRFRSQMVSVSLSCRRQSVSVLSADILGVAAVDPKRTAVASITRATTIRPVVLRQNTNFPNQINPISLVQPPPPKIFPFPFPPNHPHNSRTSSP